MLNRTTALLSIGRHASRVVQKRSIATQTPPHAYLQPLLANYTGEKAEELDGTMCLVMDRKEAKNALSVRMVQEMRDGIAKVGSISSARVLLLHTPHPGAFCAGADLKERKSMSQSQVSDFLDSLRGLVGELEQLKIPTIAVVDGFALGGGTELALGCDLRVGGKDTVMALPETKLGIIPGAGGTQRLTKLVGASKAKELIFTGRRLTGEEAERIGLLNIYAREPETAWSQSLLLARQMLTSGKSALSGLRNRLNSSRTDLCSAPLALRAAKTAIDAAPYTPLEEGLDLERRVYNGLLLTEDRNEGLRAFAEKRRAVFTGK